MRGIGEGERPWDAKPDGVMTNATVGNVSRLPEGGVVHVTYKDGQSEFIVGPEVPVLAYVAGDRGTTQTRRCGSYRRTKETRWHPDRRPSNCREKRYQAADVVGAG
jgi:hypothetical protein